MAKIRASYSLEGADGTNDIDPSLTKAGDTITSPWIAKLAMEGKVYIGGYGIEETHTDGTAALNDTTPTFMLQAPANGLLVIPLLVRLALTTEGGAAPDAYLTYISTGTDTPIAYTSGTAITALNVLGGQQRDSQARFEHTVTIGAVTDVQNVQLWDATALPDNLLSAPGAGGIIGVGNNSAEVTIPLFPQVPLMLNKGSMLAFYAATGTSDSKWLPTFVWAETEATALP